MPRRPEDKMFLRHLDAFRGFAMINVVAVHTWADQVATFGGVERSVGVFKFWLINETLFGGSTTYFAVISGILFSRVLRARGWTAFFRGKMLNVVSPYIVMTLLFTLYGLDDNNHLVLFEGSLGDYVATVAANVATGGAFYHLWYIPIFIMLCLATPLVAWLIDQPKAHWLIVLIILAPLVVSRTGTEVTWASVVYYLGVYTAAMVVGTHYDVVLGVFRRYWWLSLIAAGLSTLALLLISRSKTRWDCSRFVRRCSTCKNSRSPRSSSFFFTRTRDACPNGSLRSPPSPSRSISCIRSL